MQKFDARDLNLNLDRAKLKSFYQTQPAQHALAIAFNWVIILATIVLCIQFFNPFLYILALLIIGARQHALAILMHDATHYRFLKNKKWNDGITNVVSMYPIFTSIEKYRQNHLRHHQHLNTEDDPDWFAKLGKREFTFPQSRQEFLLRVLSYFSLYQGVKDAFWLLKRFNAQARPGMNKFYKKENVPLKIVFYILLITTLTLTGTWLYFLLYWIVPYFSTFFMFQYIRSVAEHFGDLDHDHLLSSTRTVVKLNWLERFFFAPHEVGYHLEHHLYPGVPFYNLPKLHRELMRSPEFAEKAHLTQGYLRGLMRELSSAKEPLLPTPS